MRGRRGTIYVIHMDGERETEFDKLAQSPAHRSQARFRHLMGQIENMAERWGFAENFFRREGRASDSVMALSKESGRLRIYCCRWGESLLILGGGAIKTVATVQDDPELERLMNMMMYVDRRLRQRISEREITLGDRGELIGNLYFPPEDN